MLHLFQESINLFDELKSKIEGAAKAATAAVSSGLSWSEDEIKAAEVEVFTKVETTSMTLSQAFAEGAKWAAGRVQAATAPAATPAAPTSASALASEPVQAVSPVVVDPETVSATSEPQAPAA